MISIACHLYPSGIVIIAKRDDSLGIIQLLSVKEKRNEVYYHNDKEMLSQIKTKLGDGGKSDRKWSRFRFLDLQ